MDELKGTLVKISIFVLIFLTLSIIFMLGIRWHLDRGTPQDINELMSQEGIHVFELTLFGIPMQTAEIAIINNQLFEAELTNHPLHAVMPFALSAVTLGFGIVIFKRIKNKRTADGDRLA